MSRLVLGALGILLASPAFAQSDERERAIEQFARDIAALQATVREASASNSSGLAVVTRDAVTHESPDASSDAVGTVERGSTVQVIASADQWSGIVGEGPDSGVSWVLASTVQTTSFADNWVDKVMRDASVVVERYRTNPHVRILGFSAELSLTGPSLSVQFEFK